MIVNDTQIQTSWVGLPHETTDGIIHGFTCLHASQEPASSKSLKNAQTTLGSTEKWLLTDCFPSTVPTSNSYTADKTVEMALAFQSHVHA